MKQRTQHCASKMLPRSFQFPATKLLKVGWFRCFIIIFCSCCCCVCLSRIPRRVWEVAESIWVQYQFWLSTCLVMGDCFHSDACSSTPALLLTVATSTVPAGSPSSRISRCICKALAKFACASAKVSYIPERMWIFVFSQITKKYPFVQCAMEEKGIPGDKMDPSHWYSRHEVRPFGMSISFCITLTTSFLW